MDIFMPIALCFVFLLMFFICGWCCKRKREGTVYGYGPTVTVSSHPVQSSPVVVPPYPVDARHPTPHSNAPAPGFATHPTPYPTNIPYGQPQPGVNSYPPTGGSTPYPPPAGGTPYPPVGVTSYPPADYNIHPPPYDVAVSAPPPIQPLPVKEAYGKQAPYNPNYN